MKKLLLVLSMFLLGYTASARKFYISSSTGNDSYTYLQAQNQATPWKSLKTVTCFGSGLWNGVQQFTTYPNRAAAGDTFFFKRGDVFDNGYTYYSSFQWLNYAPDGYYCPSGTATNPIMFTNYGTSTLPLPNFLYPTSTIPTNSSRQVFELGGVTNIIIDGLQFNENRGTFNIQDKANPAPTRAGIWLGTNVSGTWNDTTVLARKVKDCIVRNCYFNNISFAIGSLAGIRCEIYNNTIENLKSCTDTIGTYDVGAGAFEGLNGYFNKIHHNYVKGAWAKSGRVSSTFGLFGVGCDIFNLKYSSITYNTFVDCSGAFEIGNIDNVSLFSGAQYDTFAYNKIINCGQMIYLHGASDDPFGGYVKNIYCWNNVIINNNKSRMNGPNFGADTYSDGQSFSGNLTGQYAWWFFRSPLKCPDNTLPISNQTWSNPINPSWCNWGGHRMAAQYTATPFMGNPDTVVDMRNNIFYATTGDQMIYDATRTTQIHRNNVYYIKGAFLNPTSLGGTLGTGEINTTTKLFADTSAALPENWDLHLAQGSLAANAGVAISGLTKDFGGNNVTNPPSIGLYNYVSSITVPTVATSSPISVSTTSAILGGNVSSDGGSTVYRRGFMYSPSAISDTLSGIKIIDAGTGIGSYNSNVTGLTANTSYHVRAFALNSVGVAYGADVIFNTLPQTCTFTYGSWSTCNGSTQTRSYVASPSGCSGVPPTDSIQRACSIPCTSFTYGQWTTCSGGVQTRTYTASPSGCTGTPPVDSVSRTCTSSNLVLTVVSVTNATCTNKSNGSITVLASGGIPPYYYSINSTTNYILGQTVFSGIKARSTNTVRVKDSRGVIASQSVYVGSTSSKKCP